MNKLFGLSIEILIGCLLIIGLAIFGGVQLSQHLFPQPKVGIMQLQGTVSSITSLIITGEIEFIREERPDIKAIVLVVNSPGGGASSGQDIYYQMRDLREDMPIVASMDILAASAAYQISVAANKIYAKPATLVGNVGVIFRQPFPAPLSESIITTGPFKSSGGSTTSYYRMLDVLYADFRDSVMAERLAAPNPITLPPNEVATGELWVGTEAKAYGIIDELGSQRDAIEAAAELAGIQNYEVVDVRSEYIDYLQELDASAELELYEQLENQADIDLTANETEWPSFYQLYIPLE